MSYFVVAGVAGLAFGIILVLLIRLKFQRKHSESSLYDGVLLNPQQSQQQHELVISKIVKLNHDTYTFSLKFPNPKMKLGIEVGQHIVLHANVPSKTEEGQMEEISRKYTPVSKVDQRGTVDLLIKVYHKCERFPHGGQMTLYLESLKEGQRIRVSGPKGKLAYQGNGRVLIMDDGENVTKVYSNFGMVAGGTGIAPMYQIIRQVFDNPKDKTNLYLLFANKSESDILLYEELKSIRSSNGMKMSLTLDKAPSNWAFEQGFVTKDMLERTLPPPGPNTMILQCGPPAMNKLVRTLLLEIGHKESNIFKF